MKVNIRGKLHFQQQASTLPNSKNLWLRMCRIPSTNRRSAWIMTEKMTPYHHHSGWLSGLELLQILLARQVVQEIDSLPPQMFFSHFKVILSLCVKADWTIKDTVEVKTHIMLYNFFPFHFLIQVKRSQNFGHYSVAKQHIQMNVF